MPAKRLTEESVLRLQCKSASYQVQDVGTDAVPGLAVLVNPSGIRSYRVMYRLHGKRLALVLGRVGEMTLAEARDEAMSVRRKVAKGQDPKQDVPTNSDTFKACIERWTEDEQRGRKNRVSADVSKRFMLSSCKAWHARPIGTITDQDVKALLRAKQKQAPYAANRLHAHMATFFRWCVAERIVQASPMVHVSKPWLGGKPRNLPWFEGTRADDAIRALWNFAERIGGNHGGFLKVLLITGKRRSVVLNMRWDHIDDDWFWRPPAGTRGKRNHPIPLPKLAQSVLGDLKRTGRVFKPIAVDCFMWRIREETGIADFIFHGVRHIVESKLAELRVPPHIRDLLLDHAAQRGTGAHYDHHTYRTEMVEAFQLWCAHILSVVKSVPKWQRNLEARARRLSIAANP